MVARILILLVWDRVCTVTWDLVCDEVCLDIDIGGCSWLVLDSGKYMVVKFECVVLGVLVFRLVVIYLHPVLPNHG